MSITGKLSLLASSKEALRTKLGLSESLPLSEYYKLAIRKPFEPTDLFVGDKQGVWYDPSDKSTLFQDVEGTVPVTKDGDPVALMKDKSGNDNHATVTVSTARPVYKTDGILHWLYFDGVDDYLEVKPFAVAMQQPYSFVAGVQRLRSTGSASMIDGSVLATRFAIVDLGYANYVSAGRSVKDALPSNRGDKHVLTVFASGVNSKMQSGKEDKVTADIGNNPINNIVIATRDKSTGFSQSILYDMLIVKGDIWDIGQIQDYLAAKSGVTI